MQNLIFLALLIVPMSLLLTNPVESNSQGMFSNIPQETTDITKKPWKSPSPDQGEAIRQHWPWPDPCWHQRPLVNSAKKSCNNQEDTPRPQSSQQHRGTPSRPQHQTKRRPPRSQPLQQSLALPKYFGVTLYRFEDVGPETREWENKGETPVRLKLNAKVAEGDMIRVVIETPRRGQLYVIDQELYGDGRARYLLAYPHRGAYNDDFITGPGLPVMVPGRELKNAALRLKIHPGLKEERLLLIHIPEGRKIVGMTDRLPMMQQGTELDKATVEAWLKQCLKHSRQSEPRYVRGFISKAERDALYSRMPLDEADPQPETLFEFNGKASAPWLVTISQQVAPKPSTQ